MTQELIICPKCRSNTLESQWCDVCNGRGKIVQEQKLDVNTETSKPVDVHISENINVKVLVDKALLQRIDVALESAKDNADLLVELRKVVGLDAIYRKEIAEIDSLRRALSEVIK